MRAGVTPCTALIHECNAGNIISVEACVGAFIVCNYAEQIPYTLSGTYFCEIIYFSQNTYLSYI